jgi:8-oxo-dGTP pyrophosphatase MutT (NUDIX family)
MPHLHYALDYCVEVFIVHQDRVLLRKHDKYGIWLSVGGHIELNEDPNQAALREVREEVGLDVSLISEGELLAEGDEVELHLPRYVVRHPINDVHEHVVFIYFATSDSDVVVPEHEDDEWRWFTVEELDEVKLKPSIKRYALEALSKLG